MNDLKIGSVVLFWMVATMGWATPVGWTGTALLKSVNGLPAICTPQGADQGFPVVRLAMSESYVQHGAVWVLRLKPGASPLVLGPGECMSYGKPLPGYEISGGSRPIPFKNGSVYSVVINRMNDEAHYNHSYFAVFCAKDKVDGEFDYIQYDEAATGKTIKLADAGNQTHMVAAPLRDLPHNTACLQGGAIK